MTSADSSQRLADLVERLGRLLRSRENTGELNPAQWEALRYLARANRFSRTPGALTQFLAATKGTVSQTVLALERKGLLRRRRDPDDARVARLELTAAGRRVLERDPLSEFADAARRLPASKSRAAADGLDALLRSLLAERDHQTFGQCATCRFFERRALKNQPGGPHHCGLLEVPLSDADSEALCVEHEPAA